MTASLTPTIVSLLNRYWDARCWRPIPASVDSVFLVLLHRYNDMRRPVTFEYSLRKIADATELSIPTIRKAISTIEDMGLMERMAPGNGKRNLFRFVDEKRESDLHAFGEKRVSKRENNLHAFNESEEKRESKRENDLHASTLLYNTETEYIECAKRTHAHTRGKIDDVPRVEAPPPTMQPRMEAPPIPTPDDVLAAFRADSRAAFLPDIKDAAENFFDYYASRHWCDRNGTPLDYRPLVRRWIKKEINDLKNQNHNAANQQSSAAARAARLADFQTYATAYMSDDSAGSGMP